MSEPLIDCTCRICGRLYEYGGLDQKGYDKELCRPMCDGIEQGMKRGKQQRDQLLAACEAALAWIVPETRPDGPCETLTELQDQLKQAIANAREGT